MSDHNNTTDAVHPSSVLSSEDLNALLAHYFVARFESGSHLVRFTDRSGEWLVHRGEFDPDGFNGWKVSHGPSGLYLPVLIDSYEACKSLMGRLSNEVKPIGPSADGSLPDEFVDEMSRCVNQWFDDHPEWDLRSPSDLAVNPGSA